MKKSPQKTKKDKYAIKSGFTLVEMLVSVALFALIIISMSQMFGSFTRNYQNSREIQINLEDAQQSIDTMSKLIRSSTLVYSNTAPVTDIRFFEASQAGSNNCIEYWFSGGMLKTNSANLNLASCTTTSLTGSGSNVINTPTTGYFYIGGGTVKTVTISANLQQGQLTSNGIVTVPIQSTVSLRD